MVVLFPEMCPWGVILPWNCFKKRLHFQEKGDALYKRRG